MFIERLQVKGMLSFGPDGIDLPMEPLNVIIGPNGSGKSNLLQVLELLPSATVGDLSLSEAEWNDLLWKGPPYLDGSAGDKATIAVTVRIPPTEEIAESLVHRIALLMHRVNAIIVSIGTVDESGHINELDYGSIPSERHYFSLLRSWYSRMRLYRNWTFGALAPPRHGHSGGSYAGALSENADNLGVVISGFTSARRKRMVECLDRFYDGIVDVSTPVQDGKASVVVEEQSGRLIPATRLSDGTLRYLSLLTVLLDPNPPPLIGIEEPELGLHPDVICDLAELLVEASGRTQLVVTTHSPTLIDALTAYPSSVVACEKYEGQTRFRRVNPEALASWIGDQGLGEVWAGGGIGGNRW